MYKLLILLILVTSVYGTEHSVFRIKAIQQVSEREVKTSWGSCVAIEKNQVITAYHVVQEGTVYVEVHNEWLVSKLIKADRENDIALVELIDEGIDLAPYLLRRIGKVKVIASGEAKKVDNHNGIVTNMSIKVEAQNGNSGGGIFNKDGELIGMVVSMSKEGDIINCISVDLIEKFLDTPIAEIIKE